MHPPHLASSARPAPPAPLRTGIAFTALSGLLLLLVAFEWGPLMSFDRTVVDGLHGSAVGHPGITKTNRILADWVWDPWMMRALLAVAVGWLLWQGERLPALWAVATSVAGTLLQQGLKAAVGRERPQWPDPVDSAHFAAWPSGHAMTATVTFGLLVWLLALCGADSLLRAVVLVVGVVSVAGVGLTRMYLGVHWPTDVLGGWLLGVALVALSVVAYGRASREGVPA
ncbi:phosphatase PAP2 family protein [Streptomyces sp. H27-C3]|uniref:phosphatase PAP2 family protein n=1 Tax=Streptomyces sp. H27-C3 TaxID=3046305 RepID=UPI0024B92868|nr:phosphatase PAP2 family protein [Streptomyces sp. H27-C3]MDJ0463739.1 phosphatase PAP2 family protein [Streptomyces sp. H27-C3]